MPISKTLLATAIAATIGITGAAASAAPGADGKRFPIDLGMAEQRAAERFASIDADDNEQISAAEFASYAGPDAHRKGHRADRKRHQRRHEHDPALSEDERKARKAAFEAELFALMDADGNGELSSAEASRDNRRASMRTLKRSKHFARLDSDGDGQLSRVEFSARLARMQAADVNGDGQLSREEMRTLRRDHSGA